MQVHYRNANKLMRFVRKKHYKFCLRPTYVKANELIGFFP